ncbi:MAG TPA: VOC family protein [Polyangia bacterium]|jgi:catechol 2,3-dioxygenase-like lactoylglutathione lyase family enzyme|nr:VOC family protein [Polyangia bacterium]
MSTGAPGGVHHVAVGVRDLAACEAFYTGVLGLPVLRRWPAGAGTPGDRSVWLDLGRGAFLALERAEPSIDAGAPPSASSSASRAAGYLMIALAIAGDARAAWEVRLRAAGVAIVHRTSYTLYVTDPEGNRVGLSHWPEAAALVAPEKG